MTQGSIERVQGVLTQSKGGRVLNTSFIEWLNAIFRQRLATLTRRCRYVAHGLETLGMGMYLIGCVYNFCVVHDELNSFKHIGLAYTPAMAAKLTDLIWSVTDVLTFQVPPAPWLEPKRRGRPPNEQSRVRKPLSVRPLLPPLLHLRKGPYVPSPVSAAVPTS